MNLDELLELCEVAQIGPWRYDPAGAIVFGATDETYIADIRGWGLCERLYGTTKAMAMLDANGRFIAAAREHFPACLRRLKEADNAIRLAFGEMIFLEEQCKFRPGGSCDRALQALKLYRAKYLAAAQPLSLDGKDGA